MRIQDQVANLLACKELREMGVKQHAQYYWVYGRLERQQICTQLINSDGEVYAAFSVGELGQMLPTEINGKRLVFEKDACNRWVYYYTGERDYACPAKFEVDARVNALLRLLRTKKYKASQVNTK